MKLEQLVCRRGSEMTVGGAADSDDDEASSPCAGCFVLDHSATPTLLHSLNMMRRNRTFCDVVLHVGNTEVYGHRAVLGSASPHLMELFTADVDKGVHEAVISYKLSNVFELIAIEKLVEYAYTARLELGEPSEVKAVFVAASQLKMDAVARACGAYLASHLDPSSALATRSLPGVARHPDLLTALDTYIAAHFAEIRLSQGLLALSCIRVEVLAQTKEEMALARQGPLCQLTLDWLRRLPYSDITPLLDKTHMLYLALDNSLQDCTDMPPGDANDTDLVQDYKKMSKPLPNKGRKQHPPAKPRVLIYNRDINDSCEEERSADNKIIASTQIGEHAFLALATLQGRLVTLSVMMRHNPAMPGSPATSHGSVEEASSDAGSPPLYTGLAGMLSVKCGAGCANLNNHLLVCGGYDRGECLRSVELYSPERNAWETLAPMLEARGRFNIAVADNGDVYAVGGSNGTTELATVERYSAGTWTRVASLPLARSHTGVCNLGGKIYCIGGWNGQQGIRQCDALDPVTGAWSTIAPLQTGRYQAGTCAMDGKLWVVGGCDGWNCLTSVETFDPALNEWIYTQPMIVSRRGCGLAVFKNKLYAVGGSDGVQSLSSTEIYDPSSDTWTRGPDMTTPRSNVGVAVINNRLYAIGGFSGKTFLSSIEYLDEAVDEWTTFSEVADKADARLVEELSSRLSEASVAQNR